MSEVEGRCLESSLGCVIVMLSQVSVSLSPSLIGMLIAVRQTVGMELYLEQYSSHISPTIKTNYHSKHQTSANISLFKTTQRFLSAPGRFGAS